jgi:integrase
VIQRLGRALGPGKLVLVRRGAGAPTYTFRWTDANGVRRQQALSTDKRVAQMRSTEIIRERDMALHGLGAVAGQAMDLGELIESYLADLGTRASDAHVTNSRQALARMIEELRVRRVMDVRPADVLAVRARMLATGLAPRTVNVHVDRLRAALNWGCDAGLIAQNPLARLKRLPDGEAHQAKRRRAMSDDEIERFLAAAQADDRANARPGRIEQAPFWRFLIETACRYGEARALTWADVDLDARVVTLRAETTKAGKSRSLPITRAMATELAELRRAPAERVFRSPDGHPLCVPTNNAMRVLNRLLAAAGIEREDAHGRSLDLHALRHTAASRFARHGAPLAVTQRILGHSDPKLTARVYVHLGVEEMRGVVESARGA